MKTAEEWNLEYTQICANDPAVRGQLLPNPQNIEFIKSVQFDALISAKEICLKQNLNILGYDLRVEGCKLCENAIASEAKKLE